MGKFLPKLVSIVTLPILTDCFTKAEMGTYDFITTLVMLLLPIATLQIQSAAFRYLIECRKDQQKASSIVTNIFLVVLPISLIVSTGIIFVTPYLRGLNALSRSGAVFMAMYFFFDSLHQTTAQVCRGLGNNRDFSIASIMVSLINGIGIVVVLRFAHKGLTMIVLTMVIAQLLSFIYLGIRIKLLRYIKLNLISGQTIKDLLSYSWPMVPNNLSSWVLKLSDRLVIISVLGPEANAVYAVANKIPNMLSIAQSVLVMAWQENASIALNDKDSDKYYSKMFNTIFSLLIGFTALLIAFTPLIFALLIRGDYAEAYYQMPLLILGMFFYCMSAFQGGIYIAHKRTKSVGFTTMLAAGINLLIDLIFVHIIGITAGSISTLIAYVVLYVYRLFDCVKFQPMKYDIKRQVLLLTLILCMLGICFMQNFWLNIVNMIAGIAFCLIINKTFFKNLLLKLKKKVKKNG